jgi:transposase-like protein
MHGQLGQSNIVIHSHKERRFRCTACGHTFAATQGTPYYRLHTQEAVFTCVVTLLAYGCPLPAIVAAFGLDERTVAAWGQRAGGHCEQVHAAVVEQGRVAASHIQADELWVKMQGRKLWLALAVAVGSQLWLGGEISAHRDGELIRSLAQRVRRCLANLGILLCVDGFASYVTQFRQVFRVPEARPAGSKGRPKLVRAAGFLLGVVIKSYQKHRVAAVSQQAKEGTLEEIVARIKETGGTMIHTAYVERLNATFRSRLAGLVRRGRCLLRREQRLRAGMYLVGSVYNFCTPHQRLREEQSPAAPRKWRPQSPALAAGLTEHVWTVSELLHYLVPPTRPNLDRLRGKQRKGAITPPRKGAPRPVTV